MIDFKRKEPVTVHIWGVYIEDTGEVNSWITNLSGISVYLPEQVSMQLNIESLSVSLGTQLLHRGSGGAEHQLQVCLRGGGGLGARGRGLGINCAPIQTHTPPLGIPLEPVSLP